MKEAADLPEPARPTPARRVLRAAARVLLVVLAGIGLGLGAYFGLPALYTGFVQPVQVNTRQIADLESQWQAQRGSDQSRLEAVDARLTSLETDLAALKETIGGLQADVESLQSSLGSERGDLQRVRALESQLASLQSSLQSAQDRLTALESSLAQSQEPVEALKARVQLLRAMELVLRARLALADNNPGLAGDDLRRAQAILEDPSSPDAWAPIADRLDMALTNLAAAPLVAVQDVEAAWYLMLEASSP
jgi:septal ring factor EnvC (AmiA/AmiB activator)